MLYLIFAASLSNSWMDGRGKNKELPKAVILGDCRLALSPKLAFTTVIVAMQCAEVNVYAVSFGI